MAKEQPERNAHQQDGVLFQITATQQRKLDQPFSSPSLVAPSGGCAAGRLCVDPFDPLSAECGGHEWIRKVLCFVRNLIATELHDANGVGRLAVICKDEFGDPKIAAANDSLDRKTAFLLG